MPSLFLLPVSLLLPPRNAALNFSLINRRSLRSQYQFQFDPALGLDLAGWRVDCEDIPAS
jgi:hypothetical protein